MNFTIHQASHIGDRRYNQDRAAYAYNSDALLLVLADGMGGHLHGEIAANLIVETFVELFGQTPHISEPLGFISSAMHSAHERIMRLAHEQSLGGFPGSTCVAALLKDGIAYWGHAGDSRLYLLRDGDVIARTNDHSMVQQWLRWGVLNHEEARVHPQRNQITNCLGGVEDMFYMESGKPAALMPGDVLLLCSDGLWGAYSDFELACAFATDPVEQVLDQLIAKAIIRGASQADNATGIAMRYTLGNACDDTPLPVCHILKIS